MKKYILLVAGGLFLLAASTASAAVWVNGYYRSNGTYVNGYYRSEPNGLKYDNYSWSSGDDLYNDSYYDSGHSANWYQPSYTWDPGYSYGYRYDQNVLGSDFSNSYFENSYYSYYGNNYPYNYGW